MPGPLAFPHLAEGSGAEASPNRGRSGLRFEDFSYATSVKLSSPNRSLHHFDAPLWRDRHRRWRRPGTVMPGLRSPPLPGPALAP